MPLLDNNATKPNYLKQVWCVNYEVMIDIKDIKLANSAINE